MTPKQILRALKETVKNDGLYVTATRIGITHSTLTRFLGEMRTQRHVKEKVEAFITGKPVAPPKVGKPKKAPKRKASKPKAKKAAPKKAKPKKALKKAPRKAKAVKKTARPKAKPKAKRSPKKRPSKATVAAPPPPSGPSIIEGKETAAQ